ncbi:hypothetical protein J6590_079195 [Homalodisca vitripennis]|nr:hypothetical protein J6590_079195 [Homalodisca vitripennis]
MVYCYPMGEICSIDIRSAQNRINVKPKAEANTAPMINGINKLASSQTRKRKGIKGRRQHLL